MGNMGENVVRLSGRCEAIRYFIAPRSWLT